MSEQENEEYKQIDNSSPEQVIAGEFIQWYYGNYNTSKEVLSTVYNEGSIVTIQDREFCGLNQRTGGLVCMEEMLSDRLKDIVKEPKNFRAQRSLANTILILVHGEMKMGKDEHFKIPFLEVFLLGSESGNYFIINQVFSTGSL